MLWCMCCILFIQPLKLYLSPAHQFVLTGLPQWWLLHPDVAERLASQLWHAVKRSSQPSAWAFFCPIKHQCSSHPVQPASINKAVSLRLLHAYCIPYNTFIWLRLGHHKETVDIQCQYQISIMRFYVGSLSTRNQLWSAPFVPRGPFQQEQEQLPWSQTSFLGCIFHWLKNLLRNRRWIYRNTQNQKWSQWDKIKTFKIKVKCGKFMGNGFLSSSHAVSSISLPPEHKW